MAAFFFAGRTMLAHREITPKEIPLLLSWIQGPKEAFYLAPNLRWPIDPPTFAKHLLKRKDNHLFFINDRPIGFANLYFQDEFQVWFIGNVILDPKHRGKGWGKKLMAQMMALSKAMGQAQAMGQPQAYLSVFQGNEQAKGFYLSLGFEVLAMEKRKNLQGQVLYLEHLREGV